MCPAQLLTSGELAPGITAKEFQRRRDALAALLPVGAVALLPSSQQQYRVGVIPHAYRQDPDFLYLTGICQEGVAVFHKMSDSRACSSSFVV
jgi:intermediate cleaving peptidase 55